MGRGPRAAGREVGRRAAGREVGRRAAGREVDRWPRAAGRGPWAVGRGPWAVGRWAAGLRLAKPQFIVLLTFVVVGFNTTYFANFKGRGRCLCKY